MASEMLRAYLVSYFDAWGRKQYKSAMELAKKKWGPDSGTLTKTLAPLLLDLIDAERLYCSLSYLDTTWLQKDSLRKYQDIIVGLNRLLHGGWSLRSGGGGGVSGGTSQSIPAASLASLTPGASAMPLAVSVAAGSVGSVPSSVASVALAVPGLTSPMLGSSGWSSAAGLAGSGLSSPGSAPGALSDPDDTMWLSHLFQQVVLFCQLRIDMISIYRQLENAGVIPAEEFAAELMKMIEHYGSAISHALLQNASESALGEVAAFQQLCAAERALQRYLFMDASVALFKARMLLESWAERCRKLEPIISGERQLMVRLYDWHLAFFRAATAKYTLLFRRVLQQREREAGGDMREIINRVDPDYHALMEQSVSRTGALFAALMLNATDLVNFSPDGYAVPSSEVEPLTGLRSWPAIVTVPASVSLTVHWPEVISLALDNAAELQKRRGTGVPLLYFEKLSGVTYALHQLDARLFLVMAFTGQRKPQDKQLAALFELMAAGMRYGPVLALLKRKG